MSDIFIKSGGWSEVYYSKLNGMSVIKKVFSKIEDSEEKKNAVKSEFLIQSELNPEFVHPVLHKNIIEMHNDLENPEMVFLYGTRVNF